MPRIPSYIRAEVFDIDDQDVLLGEDIKGSGKTFTYTFGVLKEYFGISNTTGVLSVNGATGVVDINTGDIPAISDFQYVTDANLETLSRFVIDGNNMNLWDADAHLMTFIGKDDTHEVGIEMINPDRFDISVPVSVNTGLATITLNDNQEDALSVLAGANDFIQVRTTTGDPAVIIKQKVELKSVQPGDETMGVLVLDPVTGEVKSSTALSGVGSTTSDVVANTEAGAIGVGETVVSGTTLQQLVEQLLIDVFPPTYSPNYVTCSGVSTSTVEVGTLYTTTLTSVYNPGTIQSADGSPDIDLTGTVDGSPTYSGTGSNPSTGAVSMNILLGSNVWSVSQDYLAGSGSYYDSAGVSSSIFDALRVAGTALDNSNVITGKYYIWYSAGTIETTSAGVRALTDKLFSPVSSFDITIPIGVKPVSFYIPDTLSVDTIVFIESNADVTLTFTETAMSVDDANASPVGYKRFETTIPGIGYTQVATYRVTLL